MNYKVVLLGDSSVGKSSILEYYKFKRFSNDIESTIGCEFYSKNIIINNTKINLFLWDTAGQELFRSFTSNFLRNAEIILIVYDVSNPSSFENIKIWLEESENQPTAKIVICGNKSDLLVKVNNFDINNFKIMYPNKDIYYFGKVSAKTGDNIVELFYYIGDIITKNQTNKNLEKKEVINLDDNKFIKNKCKC